MKFYLNKLIVAGQISPGYLISVEFTGRIVWLLLHLSSPSKKVIYLPIQAQILTAATCDFHRHG